MTKLISKTELETGKSDNKTEHNAGEIYPQIFSTDGNIEFKKDMQLEAGIIWLGGYLIDSSIFPKQKCPVCGREEALTPYKAIGSALSGCHTIQFYCTACDEKFVTNDDIEYFRQIKKYIQENRKDFQPQQFLNNCTSVPEGV